MSLLRDGGAPAAGERLTFSIEGMTCAACAARIEKKLNRLPGVVASVNYATETATVVRGADTSVDSLLAAVAGAGYLAKLPHAAPSSTPAPVTTPPMTPPPVMVPSVEGDAPAAVPLERVPGAMRETDETAPIDADTRARRQRLWVSGVLAAPVLIMAMVPAAQFRNWQWLSLTLAAPVVVWGAWPFHRAAWVNARHGAATMDTLISIGTLAAFGWSLYALFFGEAWHPGMKMDFRFTVARGGGADELYLEVASAVTVFILAGKYLEARAKHRSGQALRALLDLGAKDVARLRADGSEQRVPISQLQVGDRFVVRPGEKVATDGLIEVGSSAIDSSMLTGESVPVEVGPGDHVAGATLNSGGRLVVQAISVGEDTKLAQIARLVSEAQSGKAEVQRLADRVSAVFVPAVLSLAVATLVFWLVRGEPATSAFGAAVAVLIIACPCALGLATPTALLVGTGRGAQMGLLIRGPEVLESTRRIDTIVLDKTGTLTSGVMSLVDVVASEGTSADDVLRLVGALESASEHPVARAIVRGARDKLGVLPSVEEFRSTGGLGVTGVVEGHGVVAGRERFLLDWAMTVSPALLGAAQNAEAAGQTAVLAGWDGEARAVLTVADTSRASSAEAIRRLRVLGLRPILCTGDNSSVAAAVAKAVGVEDVVSGVLPGDKVALVRRLQADGHSVAMVGDGVNDAAALAAADLGITMSTGTDVAIEAGDITLMRDDVGAVADAIELSRRTLRTIKGNLFWAFLYNIAALPLAASGRLNPLIAGLAMALSSLFVVTNSLRLRGFRSASGQGRGRGR